MMNVTFDTEVLREMVQQTVRTTVQEMEERRLRDESGRILLTKKEAAELMGVSEKTLDRWRAEQGLPCVQLDNQPDNRKGKPMYRPEALRKWAADNELTLTIGKG